MKYLPLLSIIFVGIATSKMIRNKHFHNEAVSYRVYKIDSINTYYLIYARKEDSIYKIVSKKIKVDNCYNIEINKSYEFILHSSLTDRHIGKKRILPQNSQLVTCFNYDDSTTICFEGDSIRDLFYSDNIQGLCFKERN